MKNEDPVKLAEVLGEWVPTMVAITGLLAVLARARIVPSFVCSLLHFFAPSLFHCFSDF
jgi:hypothetical protein